MNIEKGHALVQYSRVRLVSMSHESHLIEQGLEDFLFVVSRGAGLREQRRMKREMVEKRGWKESKICVTTGLLGRRKYDNQ